MNKDAALLAFSQLLPAHARVLCLAEGIRDFLNARGAAAELAVDGSAGRADPRLLSPAFESWDAVCFAEGLLDYSLIDHQRMLAVALRGLKPSRGVLLTAYRGGELGASENAFGSLLRQNGFNPLALPSSVPSVDEVRWVFARRV